MAKKKKKIKFFSVILLFILIGLYYFFPSEVETILGGVEEVINQGEFNIETSQVVIYNEKEEFGMLAISMCPKVDCKLVLSSHIFKAKEEILCAFYELDNEEIAELLVNKKDEGLKVEVIVDDSYLHESSIEILESSGIKVYSDKDRKTRYNNYMHNKFCIVDKELLITGSMNPTENGLYYNNNNLIEIKSSKLSKNYLNEFEQLKSGIFGEKKGSTLEYNNVVFELENETITVNSYFCPQDSCAKEVMEELELAKEEILFATFSITHDGIENMLISKANLGINVEGVVENRNRNSKGSRILELNESFSVNIDINPRTMHHKFFVIDGETVVTGSMNPSKSGDTYNDENVLIIKSESIAKLFKEEYSSLVK